MASFIDALDALACALQISKHFESSDQNSLYSLALATGKPVDEHGTNLFEETKTKVNVMSRLGFQKGIYGFEKGKATKRGRLHSTMTKSMPLYWNLREISRCCMQPIA